MHSLTDVLCSASKYWQRQDSRRPCQPENTHIGPSFTARGTCTSSNILALTSPSSTANTSIHSKQFPTSNRCCNNVCRLAWLIRPVVMCVVQSMLSRLSDCRRCVNAVLRHNCFNPRVRTYTTHCYDVSCTLILTLADVVAGIFFSYEHRWDRSGLSSIYYRAVSES